MPWQVRPQYNSDWRVADGFSGNDYGHREIRDGDRTEGFYYVSLPDGRQQRVDYFVDGDSGFVAETSYVGEAVFPEDQLAYQEAQRVRDLNLRRATYLSSLGSHSGYDEQFHPHVLRNLSPEQRYIRDQLLRQNLQLNPKFLGSVSRKG